MTKTEVITSVQRRRRWSRAEKERIVASAMVDGANASEVAREAGIHTSQLFRWRQQLCERSPRVAAAFQSVAIAPEAPMPTDDGVVEIEFAVGGRMRISGRVDASLVTSLANALAADRQTR
jgi:transposase